MDINDCQCCLINYCPVGHSWLYKPEDTHYFPKEIHDCSTSLSLIQYWVDGKSQYFGVVKIGFGGNISYFTGYISFYGNISTFRDKSSKFQPSKTESQKAQRTFCFSKSNCNKLFTSCVQALTIIELQNYNLPKLMLPQSARQSFPKHHFQSMSQHQQLLRRYLHQSHQPIWLNMIQSVSEWTTGQGKGKGELGSDKD